MFSDSDGKELLADHARLEKWLLMTTPADDPFQFLPNALYKICYDGYPKSVPVGK
jgi:hypothetical protein